MEDVVKNYGNVHSKIFRLQEQGYNMLNNFNAFPTYTF